ncbi:MAG: aminodeoxychorismate synthase component I [Xanthomonadales bacterium]|nr:aminodeoxychorismate synthase component I [Xanthomonadales bacterium]
MHSTGRESIHAGDTGQADAVSAPRVRDQLLAWRAADPSRFPCLLSSSAATGPDARHDLLLASNGEALVLHADGRLECPPGVEDQGGFLPTLRMWQRREQQSAKPAPARPFGGGWCLYLAYELIGELEPILQLPPPDDGLPIAVALRTPAAWLHDRGSDSLHPIAEAGWEGLLEPPTTLASPPQTPQVSHWQEAPGEDFEAAVRRVLGYLLAGDVFQVNLSRAWQLELAAGNAAGLYQALLSANPAPFSGWLHFRGTDLLSSSPERLLSVRDDLVQTRPIAGTRRRSTDPGEDAELLAELQCDPKERAEHIMLIDLERNDLGRVCQPGSVEVDEFCIVESYAHVHHLVSNVRGRLAPGYDAIDAIAACFPGGTITGCPKVRCMQIIAELERDSRGAYTGALGYLGIDGSLDLNILIRTMVQRERSVRFRTGAGIVADSQPSRELAETRSKARGLLRALGVEPCWIV